MEELMKELFNDITNKTIYNYTKHDDYDDYANDAALARLSAELESLRAQVTEMKKNQEPPTTPTPASTNVDLDTRRLDIDL